MAELLISRPWLRGNLEEARLDVVDVPIEHPAIRVKTDGRRGCTRSTSTKKASNAAGDLDRGPSSWTTFSPARSSKMSASTPSTPRAPIVSMNGKPAQSLEMPTAPRTPYFLQSTSAWRPGSRAEVEHRAPDGADADGHERRVGDAHSSLDKFPAVEAVAAGVESGAHPSSGRCAANGSSLH